MGTYSKAAEAGTKAKVDTAILGGVPPGGLSLADEGYLKALIKHVSGGKVIVGGARRLQFFIVKGGGEGFLDAAYAGIDASRVTVGGGMTTSGAAGTEIVFDDNDLIVAFDKTGKLISAALLRRPLSIKHPSIWTEHTANKVYNAWDGQSVSLYRNTNFDIKYFGLMIDDKLGYYRTGKVRIDLHKEEATNGCIFIRDPATPGLGEPNKLNTFEPEFIKKVQAALGAQRGYNIGTMRVFSI